MNNQSIKKELLYQWKLNVLIRFIFMAKYKNDLQQKFIES